VKGGYMERNESLEMYLETIYILEINHGHAHSVDIAKELGVSKPSVSKAMNQLKKKGLINKEDYGSITLTNEGRRISERIYKNHKKISLYLIHSLGLSPDQAEGDACKMEHVISDAMIDSIENYLRNHEVEFED